MKNIEKLISTLIIGGIFPLSLALISLIFWFLFDRSENRPLFYLAAGLLAGGLIDNRFLKNWVNRRFNLPVCTAASVYIVYNIFVYGFFMGFPVFNVFLGLLAGYYYGNRICFSKTEPERHPVLINRVSLFAGIIMALVCISSGFLAIYKDGAAGMIQNVFELIGINYIVTRPVLWGIVLTGGIALVLVSILLTSITMIRTIKNCKYRHQV